MLTSEQYLLEDKYWDIFNAGAEYIKQLIRKQESANKLSQLTEIGHNS